MASKLRKAVVSVLAGVGLAMFAPAGYASAATAAPSINSVPCDSGDFVHVWWHTSFGPGETCFANAGETAICPMPGDTCWLDAISTGNNTVQFEGDGNWQPAAPIGKYTYYNFPNHPGGVNATEIRIL